jgi:hypothetical protein
MGIVTLYDGRQVDSSSEDWRAETEARAILAMDLTKRTEFLQLVEARRGAEATQALKRRCYDLEPYYVLNLPNKAQRLDYLAKVEQRFGPNPAEALKAKVIALNEQRRAVATEAAQSA